MKKLSLKAILLVLIAALFYAYEFLLQSSPAVITNELLRDFNLDAASLSVLSAFFFYAYAPTQVIGGILYDRFGPRLLLSCAVIICALGAWLFASGTDVWQLSLGRLCMGFGGAFSFVGVLVLASRWLPAKYFALTAGLLQSLGCVGAIVGQVPIAVVVQYHGWRNCFYYLFWIGIILAIVYILFVRDWPAEIRQQRKAVTEKLAFLTGLKLVFGKLQTYWMALYSFAIWIPVTVFAGLWGIPYITALYHISTAEASTTVMLMWIGVAVGSPLFGAWSSALGLRRLPLAVSALLALISSLVILYVAVPLWLMFALMFVFGLGASGQSLIFAVVQDNNQRLTTGIAMGFNNLAVVAGGAICQPLAGYLLRLHWSGMVKHGVPIYQIADFKQALIVLPVFAAIALITMLFLVRETHCRQA